MKFQNLRLEWDELGNLRNLYAKSRSRIRKILNICLEELVFKSRKYRVV